MYKPTLNNFKWCKLLSELQNETLVAARLTHWDVVVYSFYETNEWSSVKCSHYHASKNFDKPLNCYVRQCKLKCIFALY